MMKYYPVELMYLYFEPEEGISITMKSKFKNNLIVRNIYSIVRRTLTRISPLIASKAIYRISKGKALNLKAPLDFNEKIMWLKLNTYYKNPLVTMCVDKYAVRKYIIERGCEKSLNDLVGVYDSVGDIKWEELPQAFVLKCNHGCGYNIICDDKSKADKQEIYAQLSVWMKEDYYLDYAEVNYQFVSKKIICEKYLRTNDGLLPNDYKFYCFDGIPRFVLVCYDRDVELKLIFFDMDWNNVKIGREGINDGIQILKPVSFEIMVEYSKKLSKGFPFVRMDFYDVNGKAVFGEMTFTPAGGLADYYSDYGLQHLGELIHLEGE